MKAILEFDLNDTDDAQNHKRAIQGTDSWLCLWEIDQWLRSEGKYVTQSQEVYEFIEKTRGQLREIMDSHEVTFND